MQLDLEWLYFVGRDANCLKPYILLDLCNNLSVLDSLHFLFLSIEALSVLYWYQGELFPEKMEKCFRNFTCCKEQVGNIQCGLRRTLEHELHEAIVFRLYWAAQMLILSFLFLCYGMCDYDFLLGSIMMVTTSLYLGGVRLKLNG